MIRSRVFAGSLAGILVLAIGPASVSAQRLDLTVDGYGLVIGNKPRVNGVRLNFRDRGLDRVNGINATLWTPYEPISGSVYGLALGLPVTGASRIEGIALGVFGVGAEQEIRGIGIAPIGIGSGGRLWGLMIGGIGAGAGGDVQGIGIGGIGVGSGGSARGIFIGGIGAGAAGNVEGLSIGGIGVGGGGTMRGIQLGGVGVGSGGSITGLSIGGVGVGAAGDIKGINLAGVGVGAGGLVKGLTIAGLGAGASRLEGIVLTGFGAGGERVKGLIVAPFYFKVTEGGELTGVSFSAYNRVIGAQHGVTIGLLNYARSLNGVQIGVLNIVDRPSGKRWFPILNVGHDR